MVTMVQVPIAGGGAVNIPSIANVQAQYAVALATMAGTHWTFYDSAAYPAAGISSLTFFQQPQGQGTGFGGGTKTASDTNITNAGMLPSNQKFLIEAISLEVQPSTPSGSGIEDPAFFGTAAIAAPINDAWYIWRSGNFALSIGTVTYNQEAPLYKIPPLAFPRIDAALSNSSSLAASQYSQIALMADYGSPYVLDPWNLLLEGTMNFNVVLSWPEGVQAVTKPARIFVNLHGTLYRNVQ